MRPISYQRFCRLLTSVAIGRCSISVIFSEQAQLRPSEPHLVSEPIFGYQTTLTHSRQQISVQFKFNILDPAQGPLWRPP